MSAPKRLSVAERRLWDQAERELKRRGQWRPVLAQLLEPMVANWVAGDDALARARRNPESRGSMGQPVANPMFGIAATCHRMALSYARQLGLVVKAGQVSAATPEPERKQADPGSELDELGAFRQARAG